MLEQLTQKVKNFINSIRIPSLLSFFISKEGKINPTVEEALKTADPVQGNWKRLGLDKEVFGLPVWVILALPLVMIAVRYGSDALQFFIEIISQGIMLIPLLIIGYFILRSFKK